MKSTAHELIDRLAASPEVLYHQAYRDTSFLEIMKNLN